MSDFHSYIRGQTETLPPGYSENGMRLYRHLVYIGVEQMLASYFPEVKETLGQETWRTLLEEFIRISQWDSHFYGDLTDEFIRFLEAQSA